MIKEDKTDMDKIKLGLLGLSMFLQVCHCIFILYIFTTKVVTMCLMIYLGSSGKVNNAVRKKKQV